MNTNALPSSQRVTKEIIQFIHPREGIVTIFKGDVTEEAEIKEMEYLMEEAPEWARKEMEEIISDARGRTTNKILNITTHEHTRARANN